MFFKSTFTKQYGNNTKNRFKVVSSGFTGVSRGLRWFQGDDLIIPIRYSYTHAFEAHFNQVLPKIKL